jgi:glycerol-3-phosphate dehydrogenase
VSGPDVIVIGAGIVGTAARRHSWPMAALT